jgi:hypothetical protein
VIVGQAHASSMRGGTRPTPSLRAISCAIRRHGSRSLAHQNAGFPSGGGGPARAGFAFNVIPPSELSKFDIAVYAIEYGLFDITRDVFMSQGTI